LLVARPKNALVEAQHALAQEKAATASLRAENDGLRTQLSEARNAQAQINKSMIALRMENERAQTLLETSCKEAAAKLVGLEVSMP